MQKTSKNANLFSILPHQENERTMHGQVVHSESTAGFRGAPSADEEEDEVGERRAVAQRTKSPVAVLVVLVFVPLLLLSSLSLLLASSGRQPPVSARITSAVHRRPAGGSTDALSDL
jgi:hypothetical protein